MALFVGLGDYGLYQYLTFVRTNPWLYLPVAIASESFAIFAQHQFKESKKMENEAFQSTV
jgi:hypothetical protein